MRPQSVERLVKYEQVLAGWAKTIHVEVDGLGDVLFCHATPRDDNEIFCLLTEGKAS